MIAENLAKNGGLERRVAGPLSYDLLVELIAGVLRQQAVQNLEWILDDLAAVQLDIDTGIDVRLAQAVGRYSVRDLRQLKVWCVVLPDSDARHLLVSFFDSLWPRGHTPLHVTENQAAARVLLEKALDGQGAR